MYALNNIYSDCVTVNGPTLKYVLVWLQSIISRASEQ